MTKRKLTEKTLTIADAISEAMGEIQSLAEEMREAYDNTPESLQQSGVGEARGEAADNLENVNEPDVPAEIEKIEVKWSYFPLKARASRRERRDEAVSTLNVVMEHLDEIINDDKEEQEQRDAAESLRDDIDNVISEVESVEFPGMYG